MNKKEEYKKYIESDAWKKLRKKAYKRAKNKCELCERLAECVHHIKYPKNFSEDELDNLLVCCRRCHEKQHGIKDGGAELLEKEIWNRIRNDNIENLGYDGFDMSGYGLGDDERTFQGREVSRMDNYKLFFPRFKDYMPKNFSFDDFKLRCWKGSVWWGEDEDVMSLSGNGGEKEFNGWATSDIIFWIIRNHGKYKRWENSEELEKYIEELEKETEIKINEWKKTDDFKEAQETYELSKKLNKSRCPRCFMNGMREVEPNRFEMTDGQESEHIAHELNGESFFQCKSCLHTEYKEDKESTGQKLNLF